ncbi:hypothetical protein QE152_g11035 [Popillia japonica]|uniref:Uncharacterized protein n=1 Tax=Popillia japonica TaxID=7064 RepID=A0AAW1LSW6_POPJA
MLQRSKILNLKSNRNDFVSYNRNDFVSYAAAEPEKDKGKYEKSPRLCDLKHIQSGELKNAAGFQDKGKYEKSPRLCDLKHIQSGELKNAAGFLRRYDRGIVLVFSRGILVSGFRQLPPPPPPLPSPSQIAKSIFRLPEYFTNSRR